MCAALLPHTQMGGSNHPSAKRTTSYKHFQIYIVVAIARGNETESHYPHMRSKEWGTYKGISCCSYKWHTLATCSIAPLADQPCCKGIYKCVRIYIYIFTYVLVILFNPCSGSLAAKWVRLTSYCNPLGRVVSCQPSFRWAKYITISWFRNVYSKCWFASFFCLHWTFPYVSQQPPYWSLSEAFLPIPCRTSFIHPFKSLPIDPVWLCICGGCQVVSRQPGFHWIDYHCHAW